MTSQTTIKLRRKVRLRTKKPQPVDAHTLSIYRQELLEAKTLFDAIANFQR